MIPVVSDARRVNDRLSGFYTSYEYLVFLMGNQNCLFSSSSRENIFRIIFVNNVGNRSILLLRQWAVGKSEARIRCSGLIKNEV